MLNSAYGMTKSLINVICCYMAKEPVQLSRGLERFIAGQIALAAYPSHHTAIVAAVAVDVLNCGLPAGTDVASNVTP